MTETLQVTENFLTVNNKEANFYSELVEAFDTCISFQINVAFVTFSGIQILLDTLRNAEIKGINGKVITSTYLNFTDPKSMRKLRDFANIELKIFVAKREQGFHPKSYIFEYNDHYKVFVGSSNLTQAALKSNIEWNVKTISKKNAFIDSVYAEFEKVWALSEFSSESLIAKYEEFIKSLTTKTRHPTLFTTDSEIIPNSMQEEAIFKLSRLRQANENKALVIAATGSGIDYKYVELQKIEDVARLLKTHYRVEHIVKKIDFYGYEGDYLKGVGFCASIDHAEYMALEFDKFGHQAIALTGANSENDRQQAMQQLADDNHPLCMIFTVDIFNEGIDIPAINLVLMLRPTASPVIFIQQLGRGLRKHPNKSFLTVLDFIGNHNRSFMIAIALYGQTSFDKDSLKVAVKRNFIDLPGCTHVSLDEIAKEQILKQLENENFNALRYLKEEYYAFKSICNTTACANKFKLPMLNHYLMIDGSPEPLKFINHSKTYIEFLSRVEPDNATIQQLRLDTSFTSAYRFVCDHMPAKRVPELYILKLLMSQEKVSIKQVSALLTQKGYKYNASSIVFAFNYLAGQNFDTKDIKKYGSFGSIVVKNKSGWEKYFRTHFIELQERPFDGQEYTYPSHEHIEFVRSSVLTEAVNSGDKLHFLNDALDYTLARHEQEFGDQINGDHFLALYKQYNMRDIALVCEYTKKHSAFRGAGVFSYGQHIFLFIELQKDEGAIAYQDKFISKLQFQWDSPESSRPDKGRGLSIIQHQEKALKLHLFVRKFRSIDGVVQPYIYIGEGVYLSHSYEESHKPIKFQLKLEHEVPTEVYAEFTTTS